MADNTNRDHIKRLSTCTLQLVFEEFDEHRRVDLRLRICVWGFAIRQKTFDKFVHWLSYFELVVVVVFVDVAVVVAVVVVTFSSMLVGTLVFEEDEELGYISPTNFYGICDKKIERLENKMNEYYTNKTV